MKNNYSKEILLALVVVIFAVLLINPFMAWMPDSLVMTVIALFTIAFLVFGTLIWRESALDEREALHKSNAGRLAFLIGSSTLALGIIVQSFMHHIDPWLVAALTLMVLGKIVGLVRADTVN